MTDILVVNLGDRIVNVWVEQRGESNVCDLRIKDGEKDGTATFVNEYGEGLRDVTLPFSDSQLRQIEIQVAELFLPDTRKITIKVTTAPGTNASQVGDACGAYEGVSWRDAVDNCDANGNGRVFLVVYGEDREVNAAFVEEELEGDDRVVEFERV